MKTAIYIEDGVVQLVITPESDFEKNALSSFDKEKLDARIFTGSFYDTRGGWVRQNDYYPQSHLNPSESGDKSLILRVSDNVKPK